MNIYIQYVHVFQRILFPLIKRDICDYKQALRRSLSGFRSQQSCRLSLILFKMSL